PNPRASAEVRAAFAGTVRAAPGGNWLAPGQRVAAGQTFGWVGIRVGAAERLGLLARLHGARGSKRGGDEVLLIQQERVGRLKAAKELIARTELETALVALTEARTQLAKANESVAQWQDALTALNQAGDRKDPTWSQTLNVPLTGEVSEL